MLNYKYSEDETSYLIDNNYLLNSYTVVVYVTDGTISWSLETKSCLTLNDEETVEFAVTYNGYECVQQVVQMKVQATVSSE